VRYVCLAVRGNRPAVDATDTLDVGIAAAAHLRLEYVGGGTDFLRDMSAAAGAQLGTKYATSFEVYEF
jgi:hypothetical protein